MPAASGGEENGAAEQRTNLRARKCMCAVRTTGLSPLQQADVLLEPPVVIWDPPPSPCTTMYVCVTVCVWESADHRGRNWAGVDSRCVLPSYLYMLTDWHRARLRQRPLVAWSELAIGWLGHVT